MKLTKRSYECILQPKQIHEIKDFLLTARRKDAKCKGQAIKLLNCIHYCQISDSEVLLDDLIGHHLGIPVLKAFNNID